MTACYVNKSHLVPSLLLTLGEIIFPVFIAGFRVPLLVMKFSLINTQIRLKATP